MSSISGKWSEFSDSIFSYGDLNDEDKDIRTSPWYLTAANVTKMYIGICFISVTKSISMAGIYTAIIGFIYVLFINLYAVWLVIKARNRFKHDRIIDICDLGVKLYGERARKYVSFMLISMNLLFLMCYTVFYGSQLDQLMCRSFGVVDTCGHPHQWALIGTIFLLPAIL